MSANCSSNGSIQYPVDGLVPKSETGVQSLLSLYPQCDGRGVIIAIFDGAMDPSAPGLQSTSDGRVKIIDMIDATGMGDVDTSHVVALSSSGSSGESSCSAGSQPSQLSSDLDGTHTVSRATVRSVAGLSGRQLQIPDDWCCPSGQIHLGVKPLYELYPEKLRKRVQADYREKCWTGHHTRAVSECVTKLQEHERSHPGTQVSGENKLDRDDLEERLELLTGLDKHFNDVGPVLDCVVFHDGTRWRACVDTTMSGDLSRCVLMSDYRVNHEHAHLSPLCAMSFCVNIYQSGCLLSIVTPSSSHGTHVGAIAAAYFADQPEKCGMAPGAQLVSINIGDGRLGTMETSSAVGRAISHVIMSREIYKVDLVNMSYGEHARWTDSGRLGELAEQLVHKHGVIWCVSAGNAGPALSTIGTPPDLPASLQSTIFGIGAYVTPSMAEACYGLREPTPATPYTWTSRDPSASSGGCYVTVCAPGCAITSVPNFTLQGNDHKNGTSMASPNATGSLAVLLSCLKNQSINYSVYSIRRAVQATAVPLNSSLCDRFAMGSGVLRVDRALEHLRQFQDVTDSEILYSVSVGTGECHGIYIRDGYDVKNCLIDKNISVKCTFLNKDETEVSRKVQFERRCALLCDASWVKMARFVHLMNAVPRNVGVQIDGRCLEEGAHFTIIRGVDAECPERGALFEIPITVIVPVALPPPSMLRPLLTPSLHTYSGHMAPPPPPPPMPPAGDSNYQLVRQLQLKGGQVDRLFLHVPLVASVCTVSLRSLDPSCDSRYVLHCIQCVQHHAANASELFKVVSLPPLDCHQEAFKVTGGHILEVVVARYWTNMSGSGQVTVTVSLDGLQPLSSPYSGSGGGDIYMSSSEVGRVDLVNWLNNSDICAPSIVLKSQVCSYRPVSSRILPLTSDERDKLPDSHTLYALTLTYSFNVVRSGEVTVRCKYLCDVLYEAEMNSQMWMLFDANKQFITAGDSYPHKYSLKLEKGEYNVLLCVRHERRDYLDKLTDMSLQIVFKLANELKLDTYYRYSDVFTGHKKSGPTRLQMAKRHPLYIAPLFLSSNNRSSKLLVSAGHQLTGHLSLITSRCASEKPGKYPFTYIVSDVPRKSSSNTLPSSLSASACPTSTAAVSASGTDGEVNSSVSSAAAKDDSTSSKTPQTVCPASASDSKDSHISHEAAAASSSRVDDFQKAMRDFQIGWLGKLSPGDESTAATLVSQLEAADSEMDRIAAWSARLQAYDPTKESDAVQIESLADKIVNGVDVAKLLSYFGKKTNNDAAKVKSEMEKRRAALLEAYCALGVTLYECSERNTPVMLLSRATPANIEDLHQAAVQLAEPTDNKIIQLSIRHAVMHGRLGLAARYQTRVNEEKPSVECEQRLIELYRRLGWTFVCQHLQRTRAVRFPNGYRCF